MEAQQEPRKFDFETHRGMMVKLGMIFISGNFVCRHHVEPRVKLYVPREESFPISLKEIDVTRTTDTTLDVTSEKNIDDYWKVNGDQELSEMWTSFTRFTIMNEKPPNGYTWSGQRLTRKQTTSRADNVWPDMWKDMSDASKCKEKQKWAFEKPKIENARRLRGFFFIDPDDEEFKRMMKHARRKLEIPMAAAMLCRLQHHKHRETCCTVGQHKTKYACIVEADESMRIRMEGSQNKNHEDHIAGRGMNSLSHSNLVHKFIPMPQALKIPDARAAVEKEWDKLEKILAWQLTKVRNKNEVIAEARNKGHTVHFASLMDLCHPKISELEPQFQKYKGRVVLRGDIAKDDSGSYAVFVEQGSSASQMTAAKMMEVTSRLPGCARQAADAVSAYTQVKMEDAPTFFNIPKSECPKYLETSFHDTSGRNHGHTLKIQRFLWGEICTDTHLQASCGKDHLRKFYWNLDGKKYRTGDIYFFIENID